MRIDPAGSAHRKSCCNFGHVHPLNEGNILVFVHLTVTVEFMTLSVEHVVLLFGYYWLQLDKKVFRQRARFFSSGMEKRLFADGVQKGKDEESSFECRINASNLRRKEMKIRTIQLIAVLLAITAIGAQAQVKLKPDNSDVATSYSYTFDDVAVSPPSTSGDPNVNSGTFTQIGEGSFTVTVSGLYGWDNVVAVGAINDFGTYLAGLTNVMVGVGSDDWGVDSSSAWPEDPHNNRLNSNEAIVYTFNSTSLTNGTVQLNEISRTINGTTEINDFILYDPALDTVVAALWSIAGGPTDNTVVFSNLVENGYQLIIGCHYNYDAARIDGLFLDMYVPPSTNTAVVVLNDPPVVSNSLVVLNWPDDPSPAVLDSYTIDRSLSETNGYVTIASNLTESTYSDADVTNNITYYYKGYSVSIGGVVSAEGNTVSATPIVTVPTNFIAEAADEKVILSWDGSATNDLKFGTFTVYRSYTTSNFTAIATGITEITYADTNVVNELLYYYAVSLVDNEGDESALSEVKGAVPTKALVIVNMENNQQGDVRSDIRNSTNAPFFSDFASSVTLGQSRMGAYNFDPITTTRDDMLARPTLGFPLLRTDLGNFSTDDIEKVTFRFFTHANDLTNAPLPHSSVEVYHSRQRPANVAISTNDWNNLDTDGWTLIGTVEGLTNGAPDAWYEIEVTAEVLADLSLDVQVLPPDRHSSCGPTTTCCSVQTCSWLRIRMMREFMLNSRLPALNSMTITPRAKAPDRPSDLNSFRSSKLSSQITARAICSGRMISCPPSLVPETWTMTWMVWTTSTNTVWTVIPRINWIRARRPPLGLQVRYLNISIRNVRPIPT